MTISLTKGIDGRSIKTIDAKCKDVDTAFERINSWKADAKSEGKYRVAHYDRMLFNEKSHKLIIDFGDYSHFIRVKCTKKEWEDIKAWQCKPVSLEV